VVIDRALVAEALVRWGRRRRVAATREFMAAIEWRMKKSMCQQVRAKKDMIVAGRGRGKKMAKRRKDAKRELIE
jgi:hypothetical protein